MKKLKEEKGSISTVVAVTVIFLVTILESVYISNVALEKSQLKSQIELKETYEKGINDTDLISRLENARKIDGSWNSTKGVNSPKIDGTGLTAIYWDSDGNEKALSIDNTDEEWNQWYDYNNQKWANAKSKDGSYWVWIPRYAYKITSNLGLSNAGKIEVSFLQGTTDLDKNGSKISKTYPTVVGNAMADFVVHPSFIDGTDNYYKNGEWDEEISGFWVAKYAAGFQKSTTDSLGNLINGTEIVKYSNKNYTSCYIDYPTNALSQDLSDPNYASQKLSYPVFKPLTYVYNVISTGDSYTIAQEIDSATDFYGLNSSSVDSHMTKNSEWGAVTYLTQSSFGRNGTEVTINSKNLDNSSKVIYAVTGYANSTANGVGASSTNNMTGVFDLNGCVWERVTGYITNGHSNILTYGSSYASTLANLNGYQTLSTKYATVYPYSSNDSYENNWSLYKTANYGYGDVILEISTSGSGSTSWNGNYSYFLGTGGTFFVRGGFYNDGTNAGTFAFNTTNGNPYRINGFRAVLVGI